jgi:dynein heavy chain, axonemal
MMDCAGNILDNHDLIATLEKAKASAVDIAEKLQQAKVTAKEIDDVRLKYTAAARRGAILFFGMAGLANVTNMYEYSLSSFLTVFSNTLETSKKDSTLEGRLKNIIEAATSDVYNYTCLGLFEKHKLMFSFQVCESTCPMSLLSPWHTCSSADTLSILCSCSCPGSFDTDAFVDCGKSARGGWKAK